MIKGLAYSVIVIDPMAAATDKTSTQVVMSEGGNLLSTGLQRYRLWLELGKSRLSWMVVITASVGYAVGAALSVDWVVFAGLTLGTYCLALSANAFNQCMEVERDARMQRTSGRPLPSGRIGMSEARVMALLAAVIGTVLLMGLCGWLPAVLGVGNLLVYVLIYTPMKVRSTLNTVVGAVVGGVPPMMGWAAATGGLEVGAWLLGALLFVWQIPHFLALAWMYREDYARGGYRMLPAIDPEGRLTFRLSVIYAAALVPVAFGATVIGMAGWMFAIGATLLGAWMVMKGLTLALTMEEAAARKLFLASLLYLPLVLGLLVVDTKTPVDDADVVVHESVYETVPTRTADSVGAPVAMRVD